MIKQTGLHWAVRAQIARLGGFKGQHILNEGEINGPTQSLRETDLAASSAKRQDSANPVNPTGGIVANHLRRLVSILFFKYPWLGNRNG